MLEGKAEATEEIFQSIKRDPRHHAVTVIERGPIADRSFPNWSMALAGYDPELLPGLDDLLKDPEEVRGNPKGVLLVQTLTNRLKRYEEEGI